MNLLIALIKNILESILRKMKKLKISRDIKHSCKEEYNGLQNQGIYAINEFLSKEECESLIEQIDFYIDSRRFNIWEDELGADKRVYFINEVNDKFESFYKTPYFRKVLMSYTGITEPKGMLLAGRIDAVDGNLGSGGGWHRDSPVHHQTKAICYLSDVGPENGPFQYIMGSHSIKSVIKSYMKRIFSPGQYRFSNSEVESYVASMNENITDMTAKAGTLLFADTKGIHRGKPIESGRRYALFCYFWDKKIPEHFERLKQ